MTHNGRTINVRLPAAPARHEATRLSDRTLVLVVNRLTAPGSEHGLARWLETDFIPAELPRRMLRQGSDHGGARVRVEALSECPADSPCQ